MKKIILGFLTLVLFFSIFTNTGESVSAKSINTLTFSNGIKMKSLFKAKVTGKIQNITTNEKNEIFLVTTTGSKGYGYIYKYTSKGKLIKKSKKIRVGSGQGFAYANGKLYAMYDRMIRKYDLDIRKSAYALYEIDSTTLKVKKKWWICDILHPNSITVQNKDEELYVYSLSRVGNNEYNWNKLSKKPFSPEVMGGVKNVMPFLNQHRIRVYTKTSSVQSMAINKGNYYILNNGQYLQFTGTSKGNYKGSVSSKKTVKLNTSLEPGGMAFNTKNKMLMVFTTNSTVYIQK